MAATATGLPALGIVHIGKYEILVRRRPGGLAWLVVQGATSLDSYTVGYASKPGTANQRLTLFPSFQRWSTAEVRRMLAAGVARLVRDQETSRGA